jgi:hypothetical protein
MAHATQILTSHRIQKQQAIVDIDAFGPPKQLGIKPTRNGFYLKHGWDTQTKMLGYAERNEFFLVERISIQNGYPKKSTNALAVFPHLFFTNQEMLAEFPIKHCIFKFEWGDSDFNC